MGRVFSFKFVKRSVGFFLTSQIPGLLKFLAEHFTLFLALIDADLRFVCYRETAIRKFPDYKIVMWSVGFYKAPSFQQNCPHALFSNLFLSL